MSNRCITFFVLMNLAWLTFFGTSHNAYLQAQGEEAAASILYSRLQNIEPSRIEKATLERLLKDVTDLKVIKHKDSIDYLVSNFIQTEDNQTFRVNYLSILPKVSPHPERLPATSPLSDLGFSNEEQARVAQDNAARLTRYNETLKVYQLEKEKLQQPEFVTRRAKELANQHLSSTAMFIDWLTVQGFENTRFRGFCECVDTKKEIAITFLVDPNYIPIHSFQFANPAGFSTGERTTIQNLGFDEQEPESNRFQMNAEIPQALKDAATRYLAKFPPPTIVDRIEEIKKDPLPNYRASRFLQLFESTDDEKSLELVVRALVADGTTDSQNVLSSLRFGEQIDEKRRDIVIRVIGK